jgi:hypothetical protein
LEPHLGGRGTHRILHSPQARRRLDDPEAGKFHVWRMDWDEHRDHRGRRVLNDSDLNRAANPDGTNGFR